MENDLIDDPDVLRPTLTHCQTEGPLDVLRGPPSLSSRRRPVHEVLHGRGKVEDLSMSCEACGGHEGRLHATRPSLLASAGCAGAADRTNATRRCSRPADPEGRGCSNNKRMVCGTQGAQLVVRLGAPGA